MTKKDKKRVIPKVPKNERSQLNEGSDTDLVFNAEEMKKIADKSRDISSKLIINNIKNEIEKIAHNGDYEYSITLGTFDELKKYQDAIKDLENKGFKIIVIYYNKRIIIGWD